MIKHKFIDYLITFILVISFFTSCTHDPVDIQLLDTVCFERQVLPIIQSSCGVSGCHDAGTAEAGFIASNFESIMSIVNAGSPRKSKLYKVITDINGENFMPPSPYKPLTLENRTLIMVWIAQGAKNTECNGSGNPSDTTGYVTDSITFVQDILPLFLSSCATSACHDEASHNEDYILNNYSNIISRSGSIIPFNASESKIYKVVTDDEVDDRMPPPPREKLTAEQIAILQQWIEEGALNSDYPDITCDTLNITFTGTVKPFLQSRCLSCHSNSAAASSGGNNKLEDYADLKIKADNGSLLGSIKHLDGFSRMPKSLAKLDNCSIRKIEKWIELGTINN